MLASRPRRLLALPLLLAFLALTTWSGPAAPVFAAGTVFITEVAPWSSGDGPVGADWFEVTNTGSSAVDITGWRVDDDSANFDNSIALNGITSIAPGESVIFIETANLATTAATFRTTWFGANPPDGLQIGSYSGSGIGLGTGGDAVNLYNGGGALMANVTFGASPSGPFATFDNAAAVDGLITRLSQPRVYGAFFAANDATEIGSPGSIGGIFISEVAPWSSGNSPVEADWFELTNGAAHPIDITGWRVDDNSNNFNDSIALNGITSIAPGESVIFIETANLAATAATFRTIWFGANPPAGLQIGSYSGSGIGLGTGGDAVNIYNSSGALMANVTFGGSPLAAPFTTFDNGAGVDGSITRLSQPGFNGAFYAVNDLNEIGSPGSIGRLFISEVAPWSSGNSPFEADWFELTNGTAHPIDITGWRVDDDSNNFDTAIALLGITSIASGESVIFTEIASGTTPEAVAAGFRTTWFGANPPAGLQIGSYSGSGIGLSTGGDSVSIFDASKTLRARVTFGSSPAGPVFPTFDNSAGLNNTAISQLSVAGVNGAFVAANDESEVGSPGTLVLDPPVVISVSINEVESSGGTPGDWVELINTGTSLASVSGLKFANATVSYTIPDGTTIPVGGYLVLEQAQFGFDLTSRDSARLLTADGITIVDSFNWLEHSSVTYGRCPNASGAFITTTAPTKGSANACPVYDAWPGGSSIEIADGDNVFGENMSGLIYEGSGSSAVLWAVRNGPSAAPGSTSALFRLLWTGTIWTPDTANNWANGKSLLYTNGSGEADSEGVTFAGPSAAAGIYVATERDNSASGVSRPAILRYDPTAAGSTLTATHEWNVTADLPPLGANLGLEGITWIPDSFLVSQGFFDEAAGVAYNPASYPNHGTGLFFVAVEANGFIYAYALNHTNSSFTRIATIDGGFPGLMEVQFDRDSQELWAVCDNTCQGRTHVLRIDPATFRFEIVERFERPADMPNLNNEGFAMAPDTECVNELKAVFWSDDTNTGNHALRKGTIACSSTPDPNGDSDADGIADNVDVTFPPGTSEAGNPNNNTFSDVSLGNGGATSGRILDRAGRSITITDLPNPAGVLVDVGTGGAPAVFQLTGKPATIELGTGSYEITDPDLTTTVSTLVGGPAVIKVTLNGTLITLVVPEGGSLTYTEITNAAGALTGFQIEEQSGDVEVSVGGVSTEACGDIQIENIITGTNGNDTINGTPGNDFILARNGNDTINGNGGDDCIDAGEGNDKITTGNGNDIIYARGGNNTVNAGGGNNLVVAGGGNDQITTGNGNDVIDAGAGNNKVNAGDGINQVTTGNGNDEITTGSGNDTIDAGNGNNKVNAGDGTNSVTAAGGNDEITTGSGNDTVDAGAGNNKVSTGAGNDNITTGNGNDTVDCGAGTDIAHIGAGNNTNTGNRCETFVK